MGLIAHYRLDGDATDAVGDRDGVVNGSPSWVSSKLGQGMKSDGTSAGGYIAQSSVSDYLHGRPEASISMWVKKDAIQYGFFQLSGFKNSNGNLYPYNSSTRVYLDTFRTNQLGPIIMHSSVLEWHHFCVTQKPGEWKLYQNGALVHSAGADSQVSTDYLQFEIGRNSGSRYANGQFDDVRVYDHALSEREVRDLSLGMVGHYPLNSDAINAAGYNSGSLHGSVVFSDVMGGSAEFDNSSYIQLETGITGDPDELSASFWAKTNALQTYDGLLQFDGVSSYEDGFVITAENSTTMRLRYWTDGGTNTTWAAGDFATGKESHFCVTLKGNVFTLYQDGEKVGESTYTNPFNLTGGVKLGLYSWSSNYFTGWIKDARIYTTALTPAQVKEFYHQRASIDSEGNFYVN